MVAVSAIETACFHCGINPRREGGRECEACSKYRRRTGRSRPLYLIERQVEREMSEAS